MTLSPSGICAAWLALALAACDPVSADAVAALGGETSGTRPGPLHRAGQPCLLCHDGAFGDPVEFSLAGTVFVTPNARTPARDANVEITAADQTVTTLTSNAAGNFYIEASRYRPQFPLQVKVTYQSQTVTMASSIGRDGACASCHADPADRDSPGHVYAEPVDGGVAP
jgi:hypothetical protein